jgi:membrane associated rhomboid family serine protease
MLFFIPYGTQEKSARRSFPIVNVTIVVANILVFLLELYVLSTSGQAGFEKFVGTYAFIPDSLGSVGAPLTIVTALFLHAGILHIIGNMMYLLPFGDNVEDRLGHLRYLVFYLLCGIGANIVYALFNSGSTIPLLGASGAIAGVLGGYLALHTFGSQVKGFLLIIVVLVRINLPAIVFIGYWFLLQLFSTVAALGVTEKSGGVAFLAHVAGFIIGLILAPLMLLGRPQPARHGAFGESDN